MVIKNEVETSESHFNPCKNYIAKLKQYVHNNKWILSIHTHIICQQIHFYPFVFACNETFILISSHNHYSL